MWYKTQKEAEEGCKEKEKQYNAEFKAMKDTEQKDCWWAHRVIKKLSDII